VTISSLKIMYVASGSWTLASNAAPSCPRCYTNLGTAAPFMKKWQLQLLGNKDAIYAMEDQENREAICPHKSQELRTSTR
jgi:hypothetical protein